MPLGYARPTTGREAQPHSTPPSPRKNCARRRAPSAVEPRPTANHCALLPPATRRRLASVRWLMVQPAPPRALQTVDPPSGRKALWEGGAAFLVSTLGVMLSCACGSWMSGARFVQPRGLCGPGRDPAGPLSPLSRPRPSGRVRAPNTWTAAPGPDFSHVAPQEAPKRTSVRVPRREMGRWVGVHLSVLVMDWMPGVFDRSAELL